MKLDLAASLPCALQAPRKDRVPRCGDEPMPRDKLCKDSREGPVYLPLRKGAERFWRERGYLR